MAKKIIGGTAQIRVDGQTLDVFGDIKYSTTNEEREIRRGVDRHFNPKVTPVTPYVEMTISDASNLDVKALAEAQDVTVVVQLANGKLVTFPECDQVNRVEVDAIESTMSLRYESKGESVETLA